MSNFVESGCIPALTNKNTHIYCPFHCTGTLSSTYIMYIFRNNLFGFFPKEIPNPNKSKYFWNDYLWNQIIPNFLKVSIEQIQIIPNTPLTPQIHPNTNFLWLFGTPNVMHWGQTREYYTIILVLELIAKRCWIKHLLLIFCDKMGKNVNFWKFSCC